MASNKYNRDMNDVSQQQRPGRFDPRILQYTPNAGDGIPGIQWMIHQILGRLLLPRFVIEGCSWSGGTLSKGYIMYNGKVIQVNEQSIAVGTGEWLYIDSSGIGHATAVEATAKAGVMITQDIGGTPYDIRFRQLNNVLQIYGLNIQDNVDILGDLDVDGISNLDVTDIDGTLDVSGTVDVHSDIDLNNTDLKDVKAIDGGGDAIIVNDNLNLVANSIVGTSVDISNAELQQLSNIGGAAISSAEWGYVATMQDVATTASPSFVRVTSTQTTGTAPFTVASTTKVTNLNADAVDGVQVDSLTNARLIRYNSTGTKLENATVTETAGALGGITTINMSGQLTSTLSTGTAPLSVASTTKVSNLNVEQVDNVHVDALTNTRLLRYNSTGTKIENATITESSGALGSVASINSNVYIVDSESAFNSAVSAIGTGGGTIIIESGTYAAWNVSISSGGSLVIQGQGVNTILQTTGNNPAFTIAGMDSIIIKDLYIQATSFTSDVGAISGAGTNYTRIERCYIEGPNTGYGYGVYNVGSANYLVSNCEIKEIRIGIWNVTYATSNYIHDLEGRSGYEAVGIYSTDFVIGNYINGVANTSGASYGIQYGKIFQGNYIANITGNGGCYGIESNTNYDNISNNYITNVDASSGAAFGIYTSGSFVAISGNTIEQIEGGTGSSSWVAGIWIGDDHASVTGNVIQDVHGQSSSSSFNAAGIYAYSDADYSTITGNTVYNITNTGSGTAYGLYDNITTHPDYCIWVGNNAYGEGKSLAGTGVVDQHNLS